jgi:hypothetical protein
MPKQWWMVFLIAGTRPLAAQTIMRPPPPLDSARAAVRDALLELRDSLDTVGSAAARLQRDYEAASGPALLSRARMMQEACMRSKATVPTARDVVVATKVSEAPRIKQQKALVTALDRLKTELGRCETEFAEMSRPGQSEVVRGYGNDRANRVQEALRSYERSLNQYLGVMRIHVPPSGVRPSSG